MQTFAFRNHVVRSKPTWNEMSFKHIDGLKRGKKPMMAKEFESLLVDHIVTMDNLNFALGRYQVMDIGIDIMKETGFADEDKSICTHRWYALETFLLISLLKTMISSSGV